MKIFFHPEFLSRYTQDPAAAPGRLTPAVEKLSSLYVFSHAVPADEQDILLVHTRRHLEDVRLDSSVYHMALLSAGATLQAAKSAAAGEPAFALCRPPGHHAGADSCWGFCYFNNVAIATMSLLARPELDRAAIVDFDLHYGDGTDGIFMASTSVSYCHVNGTDGVSFLRNLVAFLESASYDFIAVSAGFDRHRQDWGGMLDTDDYRRIGEAIGEKAALRCSGRVFAALEGGYNPHSLAEGICAFLSGLERGLEHRKAAR